MVMRLTTKNKKTRWEWSHEPTYKVLSIASYGGACAAYATEQIYDTLTDSGSTSIHWLPGWRVNMGIACIGITGAILTLYALQILAKRTKRATYTTCLLWTPLILITALGTAIHISVYAVTISTISYSVWAYRRMRATR